MAVVCKLWLCYTQRVIQALPSTHCASLESLGTILELGRGKGGKREKRRVGKRGGKGKTRQGKKGKEQEENLNGRGEKRK